MPSKREESFAAVLNCSFEMRLESYPGNAVCQSGQQCEYLRGIVAGFHLQTIDSVLTFRQLVCYDALTQIWVPLLGHYSLMFRESEFKRTFVNEAIAIGFIPGFCKITFFPHVFPFPRKPLP
jgi:hypothetical protein